MADLDHQDAAGAKNDGMLVELRAEDDRVRRMVVVEL
jgi:hypothetical protein